MRRREMAMSTGLVLFALGAGTTLCRPEASPGRVLADSDLAKVRGLDPNERGNTIYPVGCEAWNIGAGQVTPQQCATNGAPPPPAFPTYCEVCSDKIATYTDVGPGDSGPNEVRDGNYVCTGQKSTALCTGAAGSGVCGTYAPLNGVFCQGIIPDWDPQ